LVPPSLEWLPCGRDKSLPRMTAERRLRFAVWLQEAEKQNTRVLKNLMVKRGPINYRDV